MIGSQNKNGDQLRSKFYMDRAVNHEADFYFRRKCKTANFRSPPIFSIFPKKKILQKLGITPRPTLDPNIQI